MTILVPIRFAIAAFAAAGLLQGQHSFPVMDPVLRMPAWTLSNVPANWSAEGTMLPGSSCGAGTSPAVRVSSPDGLMGYYLLPRSDWAWGASVRAGNDCLPFHEAVSAKDFLTYLIRVRNLGFVREEPVPELAGVVSSMENLNRQSQGMMKFTADMARYLVNYYLNGQLMEEQLTATLTCKDAMVMALGHQYGCSAFVTRWFAPSGKLQAMIPQFEAMKMTVNQAWMDEWTATMIRHIHAQSQQQTAALLQQGALAQNSRMQQHKDFMNSMQRGRDLRNDRFQAGQYQKQKNKEDYVDYILDCQRAYSRNVRVSVGNCPTRETP